MTRTRIDWADWTWNPVWGCRNSCSYCYARSIARRFGLQVCGRNDFAPMWVEKNFKKKFPRKPSRIFVNSMSDVAYWEPEWFWRVMKKIQEHPEHRFLFLSKEPWRCEWVPIRNTMLGYSITKQGDCDQLMEHGHRPVSFLSIEPMLGPVRLWLFWLPRWVIVGAETGNRNERVIPEQEWLREIWSFCETQNIPLFFKASLRPYWPEGAYFPQEYPA